MEGKRITMLSNKVIHVEITSGTQTDLFRFIFSISFTEWPVAAFRIIAHRDIWSHKISEFESVENWEILLA